MVSVVPLSVAEPSLSGFSAAPTLGPTLPNQPTLVIFWDIHGARRPGAVDIQLYSQGPLIASLTWPRA